MLFLSVSQNIKENEFASDKNFDDITKFQDGGVKKKILRSGKVRRDAVETTNREQVYGANILLNQKVEKLLLLKANVFALCVAAGS